MKFNAVNDSYLDYFAVVEQTSYSDEKIEIIDVKDNVNGLNYLRFKACMQTFGHLNRNRRLWTANHMRKMLSDEHVPELTKNGFPGENGHPVPEVGQATMERIMTIDPNNMSHLIRSFEWKGDTHLYATIDTIDEGPGSPGYRFMRNILQGMNPSFSLRSIVPQRKNADGTITVTGPGRFITYDRVILPSHSEAYIDVSIPIQNIVTKPQFQTVMEGFSDIIIERSEKVGRILDKMSIVQESAALDSNGILSVNTEKNGRIFVAPEAKYRNEISNFMKRL